MIIVTLPLIGNRKTATDENPIHVDPDVYEGWLNFELRVLNVDDESGTARCSINTPESRTRDLDEKRHGLAAKKFLGAALVGTEKLVITVKEVGKYGRALGVVYADGLNLNFELIDKGYAYPYTGEKKMDYKEMLVRYAAMNEVYKKLEKETP
jgi:endonuclease YncB( thermonuclease family)